MAGLKPWRRFTYRFTIENKKIETWLQRILDTATKHYALALEVVKCQQLIKGYGETHQRGTHHYNLIMEKLDQLSPNEETTKVIRELKEAALADEDGNTLNEVLKEVA